MQENELLAHRISELEADVKALYSRTNSFAVTQAQLNTKLDNMLLTLGELKESISAMRQKPSLLWDRLLYAAVAAVGTGVGAGLLAWLK